MSKYLIALLILSTAPLFAKTDKERDRSIKNSKDIEIIVESEELCDPNEEVKMPFYY